MCVCSLVCVRVHTIVCVQRAEANLQYHLSSITPYLVFLRQFLTESETHSFGQTDCHCVPGSLSPYLVMDAGIIDVCYMFGFYVGAGI